MLKKSFLDAMWQINMGFNLPDVISIKRKTEEIKKKEKNNVVHWKTKLEFCSISQSPILNTTTCSYRIYAKGSYQELLYMYI